jgi:hypothetical protein
MISNETLEVAINAVNTVDGCNDSLPVGAQLKALSELQSLRDNPTCKWEVRSKWSNTQCGAGIGIVNVWLENIPIKPQFCPSCGKKVEVVG